MKKLLMFTPAVFSNILSLAGLLYFHWDAVLFMSYHVLSEFSICLMLLLRLSLSDNQDKRYLESSFLKTSSYFEACVLLIICVIVPYAFLITNLSSYSLLSLFSVAGLMFVNRIIVYAVSCLGTPLSLSPDFVIRNLNYHFNSLFAVTATVFLLGYFGLFIVAEHPLVFAVIFVVLKIPFDAGIQPEAILSKFEIKD